MAATMCGWFEGWFVIMNDIFFSLGALPNPPLPFLPQNPPTPPNLPSMPPRLRAPRNRPIERPAPAPPRRRNRQRGMRPIAAAPLADAGAVRAARANPNVRQGIFAAGAGVAPGYARQYHNVDNQNTVAAQLNPSIDYRASVPRRNRLANPDVRALVNAHHIARLRAAEALMFHDRAVSVTFSSTDLGNGSISTTDVRGGRGEASHVRYAPARGVRQRFITAATEAMELHLQRFPLQDSNHLYMHLYVTAPLISRSEGDPPDARAAVASVSRVHVSGGQLTADQSHSAIVRLVDEVVDAMHIQMLQYAPDNSAADGVALLWLYAADGWTLECVSSEIAPGGRGRLPHRDESDPHFGVELGANDGTFVVLRGGGEFQANMHNGRVFSRAGREVRRPDRYSGAYLTLAQHHYISISRFTSHQRRVKQPFSHCCQLAVYDFLVSASSDATAALKAYNYAVDCVNSNTQLPSVVQNTLMRRAQEKGREIPLWLHNPTLTDPELFEFMSILEVPYVVFDLDDLVAGALAPLPELLANKSSTGDLNTTDEIMSGAVCVLCQAHPPAGSSLPSHVLRITRPALVFELRTYCRLCSTNHNDRDGGTELVFCEVCFSRMQARCLPLHMEKCKGGEACDVCGRSKSLRHRCNPEFNMPSDETPILCSSFDAADNTEYSRLFREARANQGRNSEEDELVKALVKRNLHFLEQFTYVYDFETLSPEGDKLDPELARESTSQMSCPVIPYVFSVRPLRNADGSPPKCVSFVGMDCAAQGARWIEQRARELAASPDAERFFEMTKQDECPDVGENGEVPMLHEVNPDLIGAGYDAKAEGDPDGLAAVNEIAHRLKHRNKWSMLLVGFNSARFDLPLLLPELSFDACTRVTQGSDAFVKSVTMNGVRHVDMRLILSGSLSANATSFRAEGDPTAGKWHTPFHLFNKMTRDEIACASPCDIVVPKPTYEEWLGSSTDSEGARLSHASVPEEGWRLFEWFAKYCESDCDLLAMIVRNACLRISLQSGVAVLYETSTMASTAYLANRRHARYDPSTAQCDIPPAMARLMRDAFFGGVCCAFVRHAVGTGVAIDVVSAYPATCHAPREGETGYGMIRSVPALIGNGASLTRHDRDLVGEARREVLKRMRMSLRPNPALRELRDFIEDPNCTVFGWARVAVHVYITHPITGLRTIIGPIALRVGNTVCYPVGVFYAAASLSTLRDLVRLSLGEILDVYEGGYYYDKAPPGIMPYPHTSDMLLEKVMASGFPSGATTPERKTDYVRRVSEYFKVTLNGRLLDESLFIVDKCRAAVYKLFINSSWGIHVTKPSGLTIVLDARLADHILSPAFRRVYGYPVVTDIGFGSAKIAEMVNSPDWADPAKRVEMVVRNRRVKLKLPVQAKEEKSHKGKVSEQPYMLKTPALSTGSAVPSAMRSNLIRMVLLTHALGCTVVYTDTDSVKVMLPEGVTWEEIRERVNSAKQRSDWYGRLAEGLSIGDLPGSYAMEGVFTEITCFRSKGLIMRNYVDAKVVHSSMRTKCSRVIQSGGQEPCLTCAVCVAALDALGKEKAVISGLRPGDPSTPKFDDVMNMVKADGTETVEPSFTVPNQMTFRVMTSSSDALSNPDEHKAGGDRGSLPSGMRVITGNKRYVSAKSLSSSVMLAGRIFDRVEEGTKVTRTWPPLVTVKLREGVQPDKGWMAGAHSFVFSDVVDGEGFTPASLAFVTDTEARSKGRYDKEMHSRRARREDNSGWEWPIYFDGCGFASRI